MSRSPQLVEAARKIGGGGVSELIEPGGDLGGGPDRGPVNQVGGGIDAIARASTVRVAELKRSIAKLPQSGQRRAGRGGCDVRPRGADPQLVPLDGRRNTRSRIL